MALVVPVVFNAAAWPLVSDPMDFVKRTLPPYMWLDPRLLQQFDTRHGVTTACRCG